MKLVILGANGMLGSMISFVCQKRNYPFLAITRSMFDALTDPVEKLKPYFDAPCCVINCIAAIPQKKYTDDAFKILNSEFPQKLAIFLEKAKIPFIHISTNGVFSGDRDKCCEEDVPDAEDLYGISKLKGEPLYGMTIRCCIIGPEKNGNFGLMEWFLNNKEDVIFGYNDHYWNGVTTYELANSIVDRVSTNAIPTGIFHFYSDTVISKYELLCEFNRLFRPMNIQDEHQRCSSLYDLSASLAHDTIENGHKVPVFNVHGSKKSKRIISKSQGLKYYTLTSKHTPPMKNIITQLEEMVSICDEFKSS